jgi:hypothetical protein
MASGNSLPYAMAFLVAAGKTPINLDPFRTLPSAPVEGGENIGRLTNIEFLSCNLTASPVE